MLIEVPLFLKDSSSPILTGKNGQSTRASFPAVVVGDFHTLRFRFFDGAPASSYLKGQRLENLDTLKFASKVRPSDETAVAFLSGFTEGQDAYGWFYEKDWDLNIPELKTAIGSAPQLVTASEVEVTYTDSEKVSLQFPITYRAQVITTTTPGVGISVDYPAPGDIALKLSGSAGKLLQHASGGGFEDSSITAADVPLTTTTHSWTAKQTFRNGFGIAHTDGTPLLDYTTSASTVFFRPTTGKQLQFKSADNSGTFYVSDFGILAQNAGGSLFIPPAGIAYLQGISGGVLSGGKYASVEATGYNTITASYGAVGIGAFMSLDACNYAAGIGCFSSIYGGNNSLLLGNFSSIYQANNSHLFGNQSIIYGADESLLLGNRSGIYAPNSFIIGHDITTVNPNSGELIVAGTSTGGGTGEPGTETGTGTGETGTGTGLPSYAPARARISMRGDSSTVAFSLPQTDTTFIASSDAPGGELAGSLTPGMMSFRLSADGTAIYFSVNVAGTIKTGGIALY